MCNPAVEVEVDLRYYAGEGLQWVKITASVAENIPAFSGALAFAFLANAALRFRLKGHPDLFYGSKGPFKSGYIFCFVLTVFYPALCQKESGRAPCTGYAAAIYN